LCWRVSFATEEFIKKAQVVITFSFGERDETKLYCRSNVFLAHITEFIFKEYQIPVISQGEIVNLVTGGIIFKIEHARISEKYLDTYEVAIQAYELCRQYGFNNVLVVAHPHHIWRCKKALQKFGLSVYAIDTNACPYDKLSNQIWTRSAWIFIPREFLTRIIYLFQKKI